MTSAALLFTALLSVVQTSVSLNMTRTSGAGDSRSCLEMLTIVMLCYIQRVCVSEHIRCLIDSYIGIIVDQGNVTVGVSSVK